MNRQKKSLLLKGIIDPILGQMGFPELQTIKDRRCIYCCSSLKKENNVIQFIKIWDVYESLHLSLSTNVYIGSEYHYRDSEGGNSWLYRSEREFGEILEDYAALLKNQGQEMLEKLTMVPEGEIKTRANNRYIYENHDEIAKKKVIEWGLNGKTYKEAYQCLLDKVKACKNKNSKEVESALIEIAIVYGYCIQACFGGEWVWVEDAGNVVLKNIGKHAKVCPPLTDVDAEWRSIEEGTEELMYSNF